MLLMQCRTHLSQGRTVRARLWWVVEFLGSLVIMRNMSDVSNERDERDMLFEPLFCCWVHPPIPRVTQQAPFHYR